MDEAVICTSFTEFDTVFIDRSPSLVIIPMICARGDFAKFTTDPATEPLDFYVHRHASSREERKRKKGATSRILPLRTAPSLTLELG